MDFLLFFCFTKTEIKKEKRINMEREIIEIIREADMVLVGIGEEFEEQKYLKAIEGYEAVRSGLLNSGAQWAVPALERALLQEGDSRLMRAYQSLSILLKEKNFFLITTISNDLAWESGLETERIVAPCGGSRWKQCPGGCSEALQELTPCEWGLLKERFDKNGLLPAQSDQGSFLFPELGVCPACGSPLVLNNVYNDHYDENAYLPQWQVYTKWLQGTLNRKLCVLELGVGMRLPNIIRWPFEKAAYFNQKSSFIRVNEHLYQLSQELGGKGISVAKNAVDWLIEE